MKRDKSLGTHLPQAQTRRPIAPQPTTTSQELSILLRLQAQVGNQAVAQLVRNHEAPDSSPRQEEAISTLQAAGPHRLKSAVQRQATTAAVEGLRVRIVKGEEGEGYPRPMTATHTTIFKGDTVVVTLRFKAPAKDAHGGIIAQVSSHGSETTSLGWVDARTHAWEIRFTHVGPATATFQGGQPAEVFKEQFRVVADLADFQMACAEAITRLQERFGAATERLNQAARAFRQAQAEQQTDLDDVSASEKMFDDLLFGAMFAAAGGFAGGAVGAWLKNVQKGAFAKNDALIDTAKDTVKFAVRSLDKMRGASPTTSGDSTASQTTDATAAPQGDRAAAGENPMDFLTVLSEQVGREERLAYAKLGDLIASARRARDANSKVDFEEDPVSVVNGGVDLRNIETLEIRKAFYLKGLWKTWLEPPMPTAFDLGAQVESHVTRKIKKKIDKAAKQCDENGDDWIRDFGGPLKQRSEERAKEMRDQNWIPPGLP